MRGHGFETVQQTNLLLLLEKKAACNAGLEEGVVLRPCSRPTFCFFWKRRLHAMLDLGQDYF
jgi:hypothetical protein